MKVFKSLRLRKRKVRQKCGSNDEKSFLWRMLHWILRRNSSQDIRMRRTLRNLHFVFCWFLSLETLLVMPTRIIFNITYLIKLGRKVYATNKQKRISSDEERNCFDGSFGKNFSINGEDFKMLTWNKIANETFPKTKITPPPLSPSNIKQW